MHFLLSWLLCFVVACAASTIPVRDLELALTSSRHNARDASAREVFLILDHRLKPEFDSVTRESTLLAHSELHITGTATDGPLRLSISSFDHVFFAKVMDWTTANSNQPLGANSKAYNARRIVPLGSTGVTNEAIFDPSTGNGLVLDAIRSDFEDGYASGVKGCIAFARSMSSRLGLTVPSDTEAYLAKAQTILSRSIWAVSQERLPVMYQQLTGWKDSTKPPQRAFYAQAFDDKDQLSLKQAEGPFESDGDPIIPEQSSEWGKWLANVMEYTDEHSLGLDPDPVLQPWDEFAPNQQTLSSELSNLEKADPKLSVESGEVSTTTPEQVPVQDMLPDRAVALARTGGSLSNIPLFTSELVAGITKTIGVVAALAGPAFIILDLVEHNWVGAGFGIAGLVAGVAASLAIAGPLGWFVGGLVTALFAILPSLVNYKAPPSITNVVQILQYSMFGDAGHTGNEKCQSMGNSNCTALYGLGVISSVFQWNEFDAAAFMIQYNQGYPMSIPDMAKAFVAVQNSDGTTGTAAQSISVIDCQYHPPMRFEQGQPGYAQQCHSPKYMFKRNLVTLPQINQTADVVYNRMIPNPGGDCRIVNDAANAMSFSSINVTVHGMPVAIACNITAGIDTSGNPTAPLSAGSSTGLNSSNSSGGFTSGWNSSLGDFNLSSLVSPASATIVSPGNESTDGVSGHYIAPPPPAPFFGLGPTTGLCMQDTQGGSTCLPNGTFSQGTGTWGFHFNELRTLTLPTAGQMTFGRGDPNINNQPITVTVAHNVTLSSPPTPPPLLPHGWGRAPNKVSDQGNFTALVQEKAAFDVLLPGPLANLPWVCLYSDVKLQGDAGCFGPGGGDLPAPVKNTTRSLSVQGGATAWIYAQSYGDAGGVGVDGNILDLGQEVYGVNDNFNDRIVALWVRAPIS